MPPRKKKEEGEIEIPEVQVEEAPVQEFNTLDEGSNFHFHK